MRITPPEKQHQGALSALWQEAFGDPAAFFDAFYQTGFSEKRCRCLWIDADLAAAFYWFDCLYGGEKIAYVYGVATAGKYQRQGLCRCLMEETHLHLKAQGYGGAILVPGNERLFGFYEKMGYFRCSSVREFTALPQGNPLSLKPLALEEYAALRRKFLPRGGVIQEGENLAFLAKQATLYAGDGFLLAGQQTEENFWGMELLGDPAAAPGILSALGAPRGKFRTPGSDRPFAMFLPFKNLKPPAYFGLAFD